jgi:hypothetical protein
MLILPHPRLVQPPCQREVKRLVSIGLLMQERAPAGTPPTATILGSNLVFRQI